MQYTWRKIIGAGLLFLGFVALVTPFTPGSWLIFVGAELLGFEILFPKKVIAFLKPYQEQFVGGLCVVLPFLAGTVGGLLTGPSIISWYQYLAKPFWTPPDYVFAPVWTVLYLFMGVAAFLVWQGRHPERMFSLKVFFVHLVVNTLWSVVFFGLHAPGAGLVVIVALWGMIAWLIKLFASQSKMAAWLLAPYLLWVTYATTLNLGIILLN